MEISYVCTQNIRLIASSTRLADFESSIVNFKFDIFGLAETRRPYKECSHLASGYILYNSGNPDGGATHAGVGFYVSKALNRQIDGVRYISDRIIQLIINAKGQRKTRLTQIYALHSGHDEDVHEAFHDELESALHGRYANDFLFGDFNATVGPAQHGDKCCGKYGTGSRNESGESLVNFCHSQNWSIMNTFFKKRWQRKWTWRSPNGQTHNEIDYFLAKSRAKVKDVSTISRINTGSDHRILRATIKLQLSTRRRKARQVQLKPAFDRLKLQVEMHYQLQLQSTNSYHDLIDKITAAIKSSTTIPKRTPRIST
jgi:hypothetical protein